LGDISLSAMSPSTLFQTDSLAFSIGPSFSWNVLHFGRIFSNIEIFESQFRQAIITYEQTVLQAVREVEDGLAQHHGAFRQWNSFSAAIEEDKQAVELSLTRYEIGKINFQRVLDAQQQLLLDRQQQAAQQAAAIEQLIRTHKALGGGWNSEWSGSSNTCGTCADCGCDSGCSSCSSCSTCSTGPVASGESIVSQNVSQAATQIVNQGVTQLVPHGVTQLVPHGVTKLATQGATKLIPQGVAKQCPAYPGNRPPTVRTAATLCQPVPALPTRPRRREQRFHPAVVIGGRASGRSELRYGRFLEVRLLGRDDS